MDRRKPDPDELYHYQPLRSSEMMGWLERTILHNQLYFSSPTSFNDPFDSKVWPSFEGTEEQKSAYIDRLMHGSLESEGARAELASARADPQHFLETKYRGFQAEAVPTLGVFCLSEHRDDILMWSHYADGHRGVCLVIAGSVFPDLAVEPVTYPANNRYPEVNFFTDSYEKQSDAVLLTKAEHWKYEREWRVIDTTGPGWHAIKPEWLLGLIMGCSTPVAQVAEIRRMASSRKAPFKILRAEPKYREFALRISPV